MKESHKRFQKAFEELYAIGVSDKLKFLELLIYYFTLSGRGIWMDKTSNDAEKVEAFKNLNELLHRVWNIRFELQGGSDNDSVTRLYNHMKFYGEQSGLLNRQLVPTVLLAFDSFKKSSGKQSL